MSDGVRSLLLSFSEGTITQQISHSKEEVPFKINHQPIHHNVLLLLAKPHSNTNFGVGVRSG